MLYKAVITFADNDRSYLAGIIEEHQIERMAAITIENRAKEGKGNEILTDPAKNVHKWTYESLAAGPCTLTIAPLKPTMDIFLELTGDAPYYL